MYIRMVFYNILVTSLSLVTKFHIKSTFQIYVRLGGLERVVLKLNFIFRLTSDLWRLTISMIMKKKIKYTNENLGKVEVVRDFLPSPDELVLKDDTVKVTLNLSRSSVDFFKELAGKN